MAARQTRSTLLAGQPTAARALSHASIGLGLRRALVHRLSSLASLAIVSRLKLRITRVGGTFRLSRFDERRSASPGCLTLEVRAHLGCSHALTFRVAKDQAIELPSDEFFRFQLSASGLILPGRLLAQRSLDQYNHASLSPETNSAYDGRQDRDR